MLVSQAPHAINAIGEVAIVAIDRRKEPGEHHRRAKSDDTLRHRTAKLDDTLPESKPDDTSLAQVHCNDEDGIDPRRARGRRRRPQARTDEVLLPVEGNRWK